MTIAVAVDIHARIAAIQQHFTARPPVVGSSTVGGVLGSTSGTAASGSADAFAGDLAKASQLLESTSGVTAAGAARQTVVSAATGGTGAAGDEVVAIAKKYLGIPYVWGGTDPATGLDCSGLTDLVYKQVGVELPRVSWQQATTGRPVDGMANARPGDLLAFDRPVDHVAIYIGDGRMIHAPRPGKDVEISSVYETPSAIRRVLPESAVPSFSSATAPAASAATAPSSAAPGALASFAGPLPAGTPFAAEFQQAQSRTGVPARVLAAVASAESGFRADAVSPAGARGLMQFMPATAAGMNVNPFDPASAIDGAARLLKSHLKEFGSLPLSLAAYNAGQGTVRKYGGIPPYAETRSYVDKIMTSLKGRA